MLKDDLDKLNKIEELKRKLFSKDFNTKINHKDSFHINPNPDIANSWNSPKEEIRIKKYREEPSLFKRFFLFSIIFLIVACGYLAYTFFGNSRDISNENIDISIFGNKFTKGGEELPLIIKITNKNTIPLELVDLVVEYPRGGEDASSLELDRQRISLETIPSGGVREREIKVILYGKQGSVHNLKVSIEYRLSTSTAIFVKDASYQVVINSTPIDLFVDGPSEISPNQDVVLNIKTGFNSTNSVPDTLVKVEYPQGFEFVSAKPAPSFGNNVWSIGDATPGAEKNISIEGKMVDVFDGEEKTFNIYTGLRSEKMKDEIEVIFNSLDHTVAIKKPFIESKLFVNGRYDKDYAVSANRKVNANIRWVNNLDTVLNDMEIKVNLSGNAFDRKTIEVDDGFYDSNTDTIVWNRSLVPDFKLINPGETDLVSFSFDTLSGYSGLSGILSDPYLNIGVNISGKYEVEGFVSKEIKSSESKIVRVISDITLLAKAIHFSGPFKNKGPMPPVVGKETTYTIVWSISNTSNNASKVKVSSSLPTWINFVGKVSPSDENLLYDSALRTIVWNVGNVKKGTGLTNLKKEVSFQVSFIPSLSQIDTSPLLINETTLTGYDDFAKVDLKSNKRRLDIRLFDDTSFINSYSKVLEVEKVDEE